MMIPKTIRLSPILPITQLLSWDLNYVPQVQMPSNLVFQSSSTVCNAEGLTKDTLRSKTGLRSIHST